MSSTVGLKLKGWVYKVPTYIRVKQKNKKVSELTMCLEQKLKIIFCWKTFKNSNVSRLSRTSMSLIESMTLYKSIILLQVTLTEPGLGSLTTESWKVITSSSYYCCMVNFPLTHKTHTHKKKKEARKGKNHIIFNYFLPKHSFLLLFLWIEYTICSDSFMGMFWSGQESSLLQMTFCTVEPVLLSLHKVRIW